MTISERNKSDTKSDTRTKPDDGTTNGAKAKAEQLTHDARAKGEHLAEEAGKLAHKARDAASHPERASTRLAIVPLVLAAGIAAVVIHRIRNRRHGLDRLLHQLKRRLPRR